MGEHHRNLEHKVSPFSPPIDGIRHGGGAFSMMHFDLKRVDDGRSPIMLLDDFRVGNRPFGPHPHAGFSAITYVFEDSPGALRSRDSLGNDLTVAAGGIVWLQSGRGALHEETPEEDGRILHGAQIYVNLRAASKALPPRTFWLQAKDVPQWTDEASNRVRVLVGDYKDVASPLVPSEPFTLLDLLVTSRVTVDLVSGHHSLLYARDAVTASIKGETITLTAGQVVSIDGGDTLILDAKDAAKLLLLSGAPINEPRHIEGPFILNHPGDMNEISRRLRSGEMGPLAPRPEPLLPSSTATERTVMSMNSIQLTSSRVWSIALWAVQILLAAFYGFSGVLKTILPPKDLVPMGLNYAVEISPFLLRFIGVSEFLGAIGILLPALTRIMPGLTSLAAVGFTLIQILAIGFHIMRGEMQVLPMNLVALALSLFVVWGRTVKVPIASRRRDIWTGA